MKILVFGLSPYLNTSRARMTAMVMESLLSNGHQVAGAVYGHDPNFFIPDVGEDGKEKFFYSFSGRYGTGKIPLTLFQKTAEAAVGAYEVIAALKPDLVLTVGDHRDFLFMKAVKTFSTVPFRWVFLLANHALPLPEENKELFADCDGILCTNQMSYEAVKEVCKCPVDWAFVGANPDLSLLDQEPVRSKKDIRDRIRIMSCHKTFQSDQIATLIEAVSVARERIPELQLYLHTNCYDRGDYDVNRLLDKFDPNREFVVLPETFVSLFEGFSTRDYAEELNASDIFVSIPMTAATSMSLFDALACGCLPLVADCGSHSEVIDALCHFLDEKPQESNEVILNYLLVGGVALMEPDGTYLRVADRGSLADKIVNAAEYLKKGKGLRTRLSQFTLRHGRSQFLGKLSEIVLAAPERNSIFLETV